MIPVHNSRGLIVDCVSVEHHPAPYICVALDDTVCIVEQLGHAELQTTGLLIGRRSLASAGSGGVLAMHDLLEWAWASTSAPDVQACHLLGSIPV